MSDIQYVYPLIHNKVTPPHFVNPTLRRARLIDWLNAAAMCRAVVVAADAGYGKTTLLWQWEREVDFPVYWYKLDRTDRDWSLQISYLIEAISQRHPGFGRRAHSMLQQLGGPGSSRPGVAAYLLAEMYDVLTEPCTFIIDDWQFVASVTEVRGLWNQILRDAPPTCRFIFLSRAKPQLQFARFKSHAGYAELRTDALRFTDREIDELFRDIYHDPLDPAELVELERRTEGWAVSLQLVEVSLRERKTPEDRRSFLDSVTAAAEGDIVEFLAEEVLDQLPEILREFLLSTSILAAVSPELAERLAGVENGHAFLADLERQGIFTYRLDDQNLLYRYHGLFRDFLARRLTTERTMGEVASLHIHAASFYETTRDWPKAIHHFMQAGLQPQAARLIAKYGEDLAAGGRLGVVDGWLSRLPPKVITDNARLSLLYGETCGIHGHWDDALAALSRARVFFHRKGDARVEALACLKLSTVFNNVGRIAQAAEVAREGLALAPPEADAVILRLRGNVAVTSTWMNSLPDAQAECEEVASEADRLGLEQYAAIARHNIGMILRYRGRLDESETALTRAAEFWSLSPTNPFADNSELVATVLLRGKTAEGREIAKAAVGRTAPWPRSNGEAKIGLAAALIQTGEFLAAESLLRAVLIDHKVLGPAAGKALSLLVDSLYLGGRHPTDLDAIARDLDDWPADPRLSPAASVASALVSHMKGHCSGSCARAEATLGTWEAKGADLGALLGRIPLAILASQHGRDRFRRAAGFVVQLADGDLLSPFRHWLRLLTTRLPVVLAADLPPRVLASLLRADPDGWAVPLVQALGMMGIDMRLAVLAELEPVMTGETLALLRGVSGTDVADVRHRAARRLAAPIFVRLFGPTTIYRESWDGPSIAISRRRTRLLLSILAAHHDLTLSRDQVIEMMWPDADPHAAVNSLNQTVFHMRRSIDPNYREGESPQYVQSTIESVRLNHDLVTTDVEVAARLAGRLLLDPAITNGMASELLDLVRGEYLSDFRYEDWATIQRDRIHAEVRAALHPIAVRTLAGEAPGLAARAGWALMRLDPYDEQGLVAVIEAMSLAGQRGSARDVLARFLARMRADLDEEPSAFVVAAAARLGIRWAVQ